jgi:hypothetical protein
MSADFHKLAKDAGNRLRAYILAYASGATAVFFLALAGKEVQLFTLQEKAMLLTALFLYVATVALCLYELHIDARRFFYIAAQLKEAEDKQDWSKNERYKKLRLKLLYSSYVTVLLATLSALAFLTTKIA